MPAFAARARVPADAGLLGPALCQDEQRGMFERTPRTIRFTVVGLHYRHRTSRQAPLPPAVLALPDRRARFEAVLDLCLTLFHKLKPSPFQVSVINVGVTNFEDTGGRAADAGSLHRFLLPSNQGEAAALCCAEEPLPTTPETELGSRSGLPHCASPTQMDAVDERSRRESGIDGAGGFECRRFGVLLPSFCHEAHARFHEVEMTAACQDEESGPPSLH
jgi:hypothetical protein